MVEINRYEEFRKQFTWMYSILKNSYDIQNEDLFGGILKAYYDRSGAVKTENFQELMVSFGSKFPSPDDYSRAVGEFVYKCNREEAIIDSAPPPKLNKKEELGVNLQNDIIMGFWPLFGTLEGRVRVARIYADACLKNHLKLPEFWKKYLVYAPLSELGADYFKLKPVTKKEYRHIGQLIDKKNTDKKGLDCIIGRKLGSIVGGYFMNQQRKRVGK